VCNRHSFCLTRAGKILGGCGLTDSHTEIMLMHGLTVEQQDRCNLYEWQPPENWPEANWADGLTVDKAQFEPKQKATEAMERHVRGLYPDMAAWNAGDRIPDSMHEKTIVLGGKEYTVLTHGLRTGVNAGDYLLCGTAEMRDVGGSVGLRLHDHATVSGVYGNATVSGVYGDASVSGVYGNATVSGVYGNATVSGVYDHASVSGVYGNASVSDVFGDASVSDVFGDATVSGVYGNATVSGVYDHASVSGVYGDATVSGVYGDATVSGVFGDATVSGVFGNASVSDVFGDASVSDVFGDASVIVPRLYSAGVTVNGLSGHAILIDRRSDPLVVTSAAKVVVKEATDDR